MAQASPEYIALDAYIDLRGKQDDLIRKEFEKQHDHFEDRCNGLREDIENVKVNISLLQVEVRELKVDVNRMQGQMYNRSIRNLFTRIAPIGIYQSDTGLVMPTKLTKNAHDFWKLRAPRTSSRSTYPKSCIRYDRVGDGG